MLLRPYQADLLQKIRALAAQGKRKICAVLPTGGGKTAVIRAIVDGAVGKGKRVWCIAHREELIKQLSQAMPCTHGIVSGSHAPDYNKAVQVISVQTGINRLDKLAPPDIILVDEAHHTVAGSWLALTQHAPKALIIGLTATPVRSDDLSLGDYFEALAEGVTVAELQADGYLCEVTYYCPPESDNPVGEVVANWYKYARDKSCIVFCQSVAQAERVAAKFQAAGIRAAAISGETAPQVRADAIAALGDGRLTVLTACNIISEGTDIPSVQACIMLRPTDSEGLHRQQLGRVLRPVYAPDMPRNTRDERLSSIAASAKPKAIIIDMVGNIGAFTAQGYFVEKHGFAESPRTWSLERGKKGINRSETAPAIQQCPACYAWHKAAPTCPACGSGREPKAPRKDVYTRAELREIAAAEALKLEEKKRIEAREVAQARTLEELQRIERERGYKRGWALIRFRSRKK